MCGRFFSEESDFVVGHHGEEARARRCATQRGAGGGANMELAIEDQPAGEQQGAAAAAAMRGDEVVEA